jgi:hypothetical protein
MIKPKHQKWNPKFNTTHFEGVYLGICHESSQVDPLCAFTQRSSILHLKTWMIMFLSAYIHINTLLLM